MDEEVMRHMQKKIAELTEQRDQLQHEVQEWQTKAWAVHAEYMELYDQLRRGEFVKLKGLEWEKAGESSGTA